MKKLLLLLILSLSVKLSLGQNRPECSLKIDSLHFTHPTCDTCCNGSITCYTSCNSGPVEYSWEPSLKSTKTITNICYGSGWIYCVALDSGGNRQGDSIYIGAPAGINELAAKDNSIEIYPNPSNGVFTFQPNGQQLLANNRIEVYTVFGEKIYDAALLPQTPKGALTTIDLSNQSAGVYFYRLISEKGALLGSGKLIKQ